MKGSNKQKRSKVWLREENSAAELAARKKRRRMFKNQLSLHAMMMPMVILAFIFSIVPLFGLIMAFQEFESVQGIWRSKFVDIYQFKVLFERPDFLRVFFNTVYIAVWKIVLVTVLSIVTALLINEVRTKSVKKAMQTIIFLPYFLSWALIGSIFVEMFSLQGTINYITGRFGAEPVYFIADNGYFRAIIIGTDLWKNLGYQAVVFLAAISTVDPSLYEAATIDGANHWQLCRFITIPGIKTMIVLIAVLNMGNIMNAGFEQILVMYSPSVYKTGDILDTLAYRVGLLSRQYSQGAAIGLFKSVISCIFFALSYRLAYRINGYKIF